MFATVNNIQLHELETAVALFLLSPRLQISLTAGRNGHRTRQERRGRERRDKNKTSHRVGVNRPTQTSLRRFRQAFQAARRRPNTSERGPRDMKSKNVQLSYM